MKFLCFIVLDVKSKPLLCILYFILTKASRQFMLIKEFFRIQKYKSGPKSVNPSCTKGGGGVGMTPPTVF